MKSKLTTGQRNVIRFAADVIDEYAVELKRGHTLPDGTWPSDSAAVLKEYEQLNWTAGNLREIAPRRGKR
jgi:hypothetical protein